MYTVSILTEAGPELYKFVHYSDVRASILLTWGKQMSDIDVKEGPMHGYCSVMDLRSKEVVLVCRPDTDIPTYQSPTHF